MRGLLTNGSPANSLLEKDLAGLINLDFSEGIPFSRFEIVFGSTVFDVKLLVILLLHGYRRYL